MATLDSWSDGYIVDMDPRREDPTFYYRPEDSWDWTIGFQVLPLYEEWDAPEVSISVYVGHLSREQSMDAPDRQRMYARVIPVLAAHHKAWKRLVLRAWDLAAILEGEELELGLQEAGFRRVERDEPLAAEWWRD